MISGAGAPPMVDYFSEAITTAIICRCAHGRMHTLQCMFDACASHAVILVYNMRASQPRYDTIAFATMPPGG